MNRAADALIRPTAADVPRHAVVNVCIAGICFLTQQDGSGHNLSGLTVPALRDILSYPRLLQRTREVRRQPFDSHDFFARRTGQWRYTRTHRFAIKVYRAGATQCHATAELGSSELKFFPQHPQERRRGIDVELVFLPVDGERGHLACDFAKLFQEVNDATASAKRIASGQAGTLRIGFVESISWHGIIPDSLTDFRKNQPDVELHLKALSSLDQIAAIQSGSLDAGYAIPMANPDHGLAHFQVGVIKVVLAVPKGHALTKMKRIRLRDLVDTPFILFPRWVIPIFFDHLMAECARGGLKAPSIVQETADEAAILSLVACRIGVAFVSSASRWRCPPGVALLSVTDLNVTLPFALIWRKDNNSPLLAKFTADVKSMVERRGRKNDVLG